MTPKRWREITEIFHVILGHDPERRDAFLSEACGADRALKGEVESLMAGYREAGSFGDMPVSLPPTSLEPGTSLGPYQIGALLGEGGMGEVYRAEDPRLGRAVALKVLPSHLLSNAEGRARFEREARVLACLNHPHICALYGVEESAGCSALVMELVEGQDLAQWIARGPMPATEALPIAKQIAHAVEAAHDQGIIHRDLKPANIKVCDDGKVKILDFGLAKVLDLAPSGNATGMTSTRSSAEGVPTPIVLGTAAYMSPEQAQGKAVDTRTDIWAFGVILFEMLTGRPLYLGQTAAETRSYVIERAPDMSALPATTPTAIHDLIGRCLTKNPRNRLQAIGEARIVLERAITQPETDASLAVGLARARSTPRLVWRNAVPWVLGAALAAAGAVLWAEWHTSASLVPLRLSTDLGVDVDATGKGDALALSPDGQVIAFVGRTSTQGIARLYVRQLRGLRETNVTALPRTDGADSPFFSPDGRQIGFFAGGELKRISVTGGTSVTVCKAPSGSGGTWSADGTIVFTPDLGPGGMLWHVSANGGTAEPLGALAKGEWSQRWAQVLPGGSAVLYTALDRPGDVNGSSLIVQPLPSGAPKIVLRGGYHGRYLPSGHLVYLHDGALVSVSFDLGELTVTGPATPVLDDVTSNTSTAAAQFAVSASGTFVYLAGQRTNLKKEVHWMDRAGKTTPLWTTPANWFNIHFAPDGRRLAVDAYAGSTSDIWVYDLDRGTGTPLTRDGADDNKPVWTPGGRGIVFNSERDGGRNLYWQRTDGTGQAQRLTTSKNSQWPISWHPSGKFLAFEEHKSGTSWQLGWDLMILPMEGDDASGWTAGTPAVFLDSPAAEKEPNFSSDGRWIAYQSDETGRDEVYVRPFQAPGDGWRISTDGGSFPTWSHVKRELFYSLNGQIMVALYAVKAGAFRAEKPHALPDARFTAAGPARMFDLHPDGERFAVAPPVQEEVRKRDHVVVILNFLDELRRMAPMTKK